MVSRIKMLMEYFQMRPAQFSDAIGMQRSAVSHVLSGRNKPSLDFILRIKKRFPEVNLDWLLLGNGSMVRDGEKTAGGMPELFSSSSVESAEKPALSAANKAKEDFSSEEIPRESSDIPKRKENEGMKKTVAVRVDGRRIEQVLFFYRDGTFRAYQPQE